MTTDKKVAGVIPAVANPRLGSPNTQNRLTSAKQVRRQSLFGHHHQNDLALDRQRIEITKVWGCGFITSCMLVILQVLQPLRAHFTHEAEKTHSSQSQDPTPTDSASGSSHRCLLSSPDCSLLPVTPASLRSTQ